MQRIPFVRGAAVLALLALGACDTTRSTSPDPTETRARLSYSSASPTVSNSGGTPLVSWNAVTNATGYTVRFIILRYVNGSYAGRGISTLASTTGTSYLDTSHSYTGQWSCSDEGPDGSTYTYVYEYEVITTRSDGTTLSERVYAPVGEC